MAIVSNRVLGGIRYPSGPIEGAPLMLARGIATLGAGGSVNVSIPGFPADAGAQAVFDTTSPGAVGPLVTGYNSGTGILQIASGAAAADANNIVSYLLYYF